MRKSLLLTSLFAIALLTLGSGLALAGNCSSGKTASASSHCSTKGAAATTASADAAACATKGASADAAACAAACASKGASADAAAACAAACASGAHAASADGDFFIANYMGLRAAMDKHCNASMTTAATQWQQGLHEILASGKAEEHRSALMSLAKQLEQWPSENDAQQARFSQISEWTASYCEMFPEKTAGTKVVTCPTSGHRWVETASAEGDTQG